MNINEIKAEIERLQPEVEAAWIEFKRLEEQSLPARDHWIELHKRTEALKNAILILEPASPHEHTA